MLVALALGGSPAAAPAGDLLVVIEDHAEAPVRVTRATAQEAGDRVRLRTTVVHQGETPVKVVSLIVAVHDAAHEPLDRRILSRRKGLAPGSRGTALFEVPRTGPGADHVTVVVQRVEFRGGTVWEPPGDASGSAALLRRAAEAGDRAGMRGLGLAYFEGRGVIRDDVLAYVWLRLSAALGDETAPAARDHVGRRLSAADLAWARDHADWRLAAEFVFP
jgi:hypothetical protein